MSGFKIMITPSYTIGGWKKLASVDIINLITKFQTDIYENKKKALGPRALSLGSRKNEIKTARQRIMIKIWKRNKPTASLTKFRK